MKKVLFVSLMLAVFSLAFAILMSVANPIKPGTSQPSASLPTSNASPSETSAVSCSPSSSPFPDAEYASQDDSISVRVSVSGATVHMSMREYLIGVVAAEMPASFDMEALKAQAVAARTETLYHMLEFNSETHPDADVCSDSTCCQAYKTDSELRTKWGDTYNANMEKIEQAVESTDGECLTYQAAPIQAVFHSSSAGQTAGSGEVWDFDIPYLISVKSPETADDVPNYVSAVTVALSDFKDTVIKHFPNASFPKDKTKWVTDITYTASGRISSLKLGGVTVTGPLLRSMFGLRSTAARIDMSDNNVTFTTTGYGHGVGMSQYGANALARDGKSYKDILNWYYTGVTFSEEKDLT